MSEVNLSIPNKKTERAYRAFAAAMAAIAEDVFPTTLARLMDEGAHWHDAWDEAVHVAEEMKAATPDFLIPRTWEFVSGEVKVSLQGPNTSMTPYTLNITGDGQAVPQVFDAAVKCLWKLNLLESR